MEDEVEGFLLLTSLSRPRAYREIHYGVWEELYQLQTDLCDRARSCKAGCPTCRVKVQRFRHSSKGESETHKNPDFSRRQKPLVAGFATMGKPQGSKDKGKDRDLVGTRTCLR